MELPLALRPPAAALGGGGGGSVGEPAPLAKAASPEKSGQPSGLSWGGATPAQRCVWPKPALHPQTNPHRQQELLRSLPPKPNTLEHKTIPSGVFDPSSEPRITLLDHGTQGVFH